MRRDRVDTEGYLVHSCHRTKLELVPHTLLLPLAADIEGTGPRPARNAVPPGKPTKWCGRWRT